MNEHRATLHLKLGELYHLLGCDAAFFAYLETSGRYPEAGEWAEWMPDIEAQYLTRFREDGSVKGETVRKKFADVGRNDPCPCGSGKKFKKCCMALLT